MLPPLRPSVVGEEGLCYLNESIVERLVDIGCAIECADYVNVPFEVQPRRRELCRARVCRELSDSLRVDGTAEANIAEAHLFPADLNCGSLDLKVSSSSNTFRTSNFLIDKLLTSQVIPL